MLDDWPYHSSSIPIVYVDKDGILNILAGFGTDSFETCFSSGLSYAAFQVHFRIKVSDFKDGERYEFDNSVARVTNAKKDSMLEINATCDQVDNYIYSTWREWFDYDTEIICGWVSFNGVDFNSGTIESTGFHYRIGIETIKFEVSFRDNSGRVFHMKDGYFYGDGTYRAIEKLYDN